MAPWAIGFPVACSGPAAGFANGSHPEQELPAIDPVVIHTYGKVGSSAIHTAIGRVPGFDSFQTHFMTEEGVAEAQNVHQAHEWNPEHLKVGVMIRKRLAAHPRRRFRVITLVREPVARTVSNLFQNFALLVGARDIGQVPLDELVAIAARQVRGSLAYTEKWFDRELSGVLGFDFSAIPFDREVGFSIIRHGRFDLLAGKLEMLAVNGPEFLGRFLDLGRDLNIPKSRTRSATSDASLYEQVRNDLKLPAALLDEVYQSRVCRHFYTAAELDGFRKHWIRE